jgi:hypothetical protein
MQQKSSQTASDLAPTPWDSIDPLAPEMSEPVPFLPRIRSTSAWTIPLICAGIAIIACCLLIPAADENRRLAYESQLLKTDREQLEKQVQTNQDFLKHVGQDPTLAERLAQRQMKMVREGTSVLELKGQQLRASASPFMLVTLPPPAEQVPYQPIGGSFSNLCRQPRSQLYMIGGSLLMIATGLVLSHGRE